MTTIPDEPRIETLEITDDTITAHRLDGRTISVPLIWSWRLAAATPEQRQRYEIIGGGQGVHWPKVDEDISVRGMLEGIPGPAAQGEASSTSSLTLPL